MKSQTRVEDGLPEKSGNYLCYGPELNLLKQPTPETGNKGEWTTKWGTERLDAKLLAFRKWTIPIFVGNRQNPFYIQADTKEEAETTAKRICEAVNFCRGAFTETLQLINLADHPTLVQICEENQRFRAELAKAQDVLDLMRDEFKRINSVVKCCVDWHNASEVQGICERAVKGIEQTTPVITQRDKFESDLTRANDEVKRLREEIRKAVK